MKVEILKRAQSIQMELEDIRYRIRIIRESELVMRYTTETLFDSIKTVHFSRLFTDERISDIKEFILAPLEKEKEALEKELEDL